MNRCRLSPLLLLLACLPAGCEPTSTPEPTPVQNSPQVPDNVLFRINLESPDIALDEPGAHAFLCAVDGTAVILTAFHVAESLTHQRDSVDSPENEIRITSLQGGAVSSAF
jgi:hypothetical protein